VATATVIAPGRIDLDQVSALALRADGLVAVGDEAFALVTAPLAGDAVGAGTNHPVEDLVEDPGPKSDWEALATDGEGRVFAIQEETATVTVFSADLTERLQTIELRADDGPDHRARKLLDGDNRGPEGMLLLARGHLLAVKQRKPVMLVEFGPRDDDARGFGPDAQLAPGIAFALSGTELFPLRSWKLRDEDDVKSANDLAVDGEGRLHAISSKTRCIYELRPDGDHAVAAARWHLADDVGASKDRNAEGLAFDPHDRPIVALDVQDSDANLFVLERLPR
jgi:hypothetical protein